MNQTQVALEKQVGIVGVGRIHPKSWFTYPIAVPYGYLSLFEELLEHAMRQMEKSKVVIEHIHNKEQEYIIAKSSWKQ